MRSFPALARRTAVPLIAAAVALAGGSLAPAGAATGDSWKVPAQAWLTIKGHGYGHGHGMSQYGAEGAAREGLSAREIIDFYYPGTTWGTAKGPVSVLITADTDDDLVVVARPGLVLRDSAVEGRTVLPDNGASRWRIDVGGAGSDRVSFLKGGRWHRFSTLRGTGQLGAAGQPITLVTPSGTRAYRGWLQLAAPSGSSRARDTVNVLTLENYVRGVVPLEIPALWSPAAVQAQSIAARTYASYERAHPLGSTYQICDTSSCQVYGGYDAEHPAANDAVDATRRQALLADGEPAFTQFGASSGGWTSAGSVSYLTAREDPYDGWSGNPVHAWSLKLADTRLEQAWPALGNLQRITVTRRDGNGDWGGRVAAMTLVGSDGKVVVSGDTFRSVLGLRSTWLTFKVGQRSGARQVMAPRDATPDVLTTGTR
ncbi:SpoIID/LytB domain-containing protein [Nocardioides sp. KIGAM211]|uniref:SpoIID/LytB domain-containing protein n=1 Tax=Nocardioides luti TaxID=2761101 RepID=A0A7X0RIG7_9ACTN|nr:SpoIID/LytB domain-containing protein [Nocardioides luti]MBB6628936.1 SpoIID/LytB domain-containing protein [Nocardioides luti]